MAQENGPLAAANTAQLLAKSDVSRAETADGRQRPMLTVFHRDGDVVRHFWSSELFYAPTDPGQDPRHVATLEPLWNMFDLIPEGRPRGWEEQLSYG